MTRRVTAAGVIYEFQPSYVPSPGYFWRALIGPAYRAASDPHAYDWSQHDLGATIANAQFSTGVSFAVTPDSAYIEIHGASGLLPAPAGAWVGPAAGSSTEGWEYVTYRQLTEFYSPRRLEYLIRESLTTADHDGHHGLGATVKPWWIIESDNGEFTLSEEENDELLVNRWRAQLSGTRVPIVIMRNYHLAIIQRSNHPAGPWTNYCVGFTNSPQMRDDSQRRGDWSLQLISSMQLLELTEIAGLRVGSFDLAQHGSTSSSAPVPDVAAYKVRGLADFTAANPTFGPDNAINPDATAPWISDRLTGTDDRNTPGYGGFTEIFIALGEGQNPGGRYIEISGRATRHVVVRGWDSDDEIDMQIEVPSMELGADDTLILAENADIFSAENPSASPARIYELSNTDWPHFLGRLRPAGGALAFVFESSYQSVVKWGDQTSVPGDYDDDSWVGDPLPAPAPGEIIKYDAPNGSAATISNATEWLVGRVQSPGYYITDDGDDVWWSVQLPDMGLVSRDDLSAASPAIGEALYLDNESGPSTDGLPVAGTLQIGGERIDYTGKALDHVIVAARGVAGGTAAADHVAGDQILIVAEGVATAAPPIGTITWARSGGIYWPRDFEVLTSPLPARTPDQSRHEDDYTHTYTISGHLEATGTLAVDPARQRVKTISFGFKYMNSEQGQGRARLNRVTAGADPAYYDSSHWLAGTRSAAEVLAQLLQAAGLPQAAIQLLGGTISLAEQQTAPDLAAAVIADLADQTDTRVQTGLDSKVTIGPGPFWTVASGSLEPTHTWSESNTSQIEELRVPGGSVSQIRLTWRNGDNSASGLAVYPAERAATGKIQELGPLIYPSQLAADRAARRRYYLARFPHTALVTSADPDLEAQTGDVHDHNWQFDPEQPARRGRYLVRGLDQRWARMSVQTIVTLQEIERES